MGSEDKHNTEFQFALSLFRLASTGSAVSTMNTFYYNSSSYSLLQSMNYTMMFIRLSDELVLLRG